MSEPAAAAASAAATASPPATPASPVVASRMPQREANVNTAASRTAHRGKSLKADMKKATIFAKRLRTFTDPVRDTAAVAADLDAVALGMFVSEAAQHAAAGIVENTKLRFEDCIALVDVCSSIHRRYDAFQPELESKMREAMPAVIAPALEEMKQKFSFQNQQAATTSSTTSDEPTGSEVAARIQAERARVYVKIVSEMVFVALLPPAIIEESIINPMLAVLDKAPTNHLTQQSLFFLNTVVKHCGIEITGGRIPGPASLANTAQERIDAAKARDAEKYAPDLGTPSNKEATRIHNNLKKLCSSASALCRKLKAAVEQQWKRLLERNELQGESKELNAQFKVVKTEVEALMQHTETLALAMGEPELVVKGLDLPAPGANKGSAGDVVVSSRLGDLYTVRECEALSRFDNDEQTLFYEGVPMIDHLIPVDQAANPTMLDDAALQADEPAVPAAVEPEYVEVDEHIARLQQECVATSYTDAWLAKFLRLATKLHPNSALPPEAVQAHEAAAAGTAASSQADGGDDNTATANNEHQQQAQSAPQPPRKTASLSVAKIFFTNCRRRLMSELRYVRGNALEMIPFYARVVAALSRCFKDVGEYLTAKFEGDSLFTADTTNNAAGAFARRMRNARFLAELTKFRVAPPGKILRVMGKVAEQLGESSMNAEILACMVEHVGPFLIRGGITSTKMKQLVDETKSRLSSGSTVLPEHLLDQLQHAFETVRKAALPRSSMAARQVIVKPRSLLEEYCRHLLFHELAEPQRFTHVLQQMLKMPWNEEEPRQLMARLLRDTASCRWDRLYLLARLTARLATIYPWVALVVLDCIFEDIRLDLEFPHSGARSAQQRLQDLKYIAELFLQRVVPTAVFLYVLAQQILYFPHGGKAAQSRTDYSRIRGVCTLLESTGFSFCDFSASPFVIRTTKKLMLHFFHLVHLKERPLPHDLDFKLAETVAKATSMLNTASAHPNQVNLARQMGNPVPDFKLSFPPTLAQAEELVKDRRAIFADSGGASSSSSSSSPALSSVNPGVTATAAHNSFEKLLAMLEQISNKSASGGKAVRGGFTSFATGGVPTKPWQLPVIDGVLAGTGSSVASSAFESEQGFAKAGLASADARAVGDAVERNVQKQIAGEQDDEGDEDEEFAEEDDEEDDSDFDEEEEEEEETDSDDEEAEIERRRQEERERRRRQEEERLQEMAAGTFSRGGHWAKYAAQRTQQQHHAGGEDGKQSNSNSKDKQNGDDDDAEQDADQLDTMLHELLRESAVEATQKVRGGVGMARVDRNTEERLGRLHMMKAKAANSNSTNSNTTSTAPVTTGAAMKMTFMRRSAGDKIEAREILIPASSDLAKANAASRQAQEAEQEEVRRQTLRLAREELADATGSSTGAAAAGGKGKNVKRGGKVDQRASWERKLFSGGGNERQDD